MESIQPSTDIDDSDDEEDMSPLPTRSNYTLQVSLKVSSAVCVTSGRYCAESVHQHVLIYWVLCQISTTACVLVQDILSGLYSCICCCEGYCQVCTAVCVVVKDILSGLYSCVSALLCKIFSVCCCAGYSVRSVQLCMCVVVQDILCVLLSRIFCQTLMS